MTAPSLVTRRRWLRRAAAGLAVAGGLPDLARRWSRVDARHAGRRAAGAHGRQRALRRRVADRPAPRPRTAARDRAAPGAVRRVPGLRRLARPIEILFDQGFGDLFPVRVAGNVVSPEVVGSLEFGTRVLGAQVLMVLGHGGCGAVSATMKGDAVPGQISALYQHIAPAVDDAGGDLDTAIAHNVRLQARLLHHSPVIAELVRDGRLLVTGGVYDLASGRVRLLDGPSCSPDSPRSLNALNFQHLLYFWTVAREGSVARATQVLHLAQPTISGQIKILERSLGERLFERSGRGIALTEVGQVVFR